MSQPVGEPAFTAITSYTRQIYQLLRCIGFLPMAQVQLAADGIRFSVEDSRSMQGHAFLDQSLFTTYNYTPAYEHSNTQARNKEVDEDNDDPTANAAEEDNDIVISFGISLAALLECLQIFGADSRESKFSSGGSMFNNFTGGSNAMFEQGPMRASGICRMMYQGEGHPLCIILEEGGVTTTCELTTYEPDAQEDIPLDREHLLQKIILKGQWLYDAVQELDSANAETLILSTTPVKPFFVLSSVGDLGSASVEFTNDRNLLEVFSVKCRSQNRYKFKMIRTALRAMGMATKVSLRGDIHGVLSLQFMIDCDGLSAPVFVDFRFLPLQEMDSDREDGDGEEEREDSDYDDDAY